MKWRPVISLILALTICLFASGCWDRREPEEMAFVIALGFDYDSETEQYKIIAQIANPLGMGESQNGGSTNRQTPCWTITAMGHTPVEAARDLAKESTRELFWSHVATVLFSEQLARRGISPVLDLIERSRQLRTIERPAVVEGDLAALMAADFPLEETGARGLMRQMVTIIFERGMFPSKTIRELNITAALPGKELFLGRLLVTSGIEGDESTQEGEGAAPNPVEIRGGAVFKGDRMLDWLDERETAGWNWVGGRIDRAIIIVKSPLEEGEYLTVEIFQALAQVKPVKNGDEIRIQVKISMEGRLDDATSLQELEPADIETIERRMTEVVRNDIEGLLAKAQALNSDILGLGNAIYRKMPREWIKIEDSWDELFPRLTADIEIKAELRRSGLTLESLKFR